MVLFVLCGVGGRLHPTTANEAIHSRITVSKRHVGTVLDPLHPSWLGKHQLLRERTMYSAWTMMMALGYVDFSLHGT
jgi:hypothetical protein